MYSMEQFIRSSLLLLFLTALSVFSPGHPYLCMLLSGILMLIFSAVGLYDKPGRLLLMGQAAVSCLFAFLSGNIFAFLIFCEFRPCQSNNRRIVFPPAVYFIFCLLCRNGFFRKHTAMQSGIGPFPVILCGVILLTALSAVMLTAEYLTEKYLSTRNRIAQAVSVTAVNELYQKKLNQELVIKNYLADKNARLEERENISRSIHNSVGHSITAAILTLDAADVLFDDSPDKAREKMRLANERIHTSLDSIRHAVRVLDTENPFIGIKDFITELSAVNDSFVMDTSITIRSDFSDVSPELYLPHEHTEFLTGALQELLSNGVRHGNAKLFTVSLTADSGHIRLCVSDNGASDFSPQNAADKIRNGFGLKKLISYTKRCGGGIVFENENGFRTSITLPLYMQAAQEQTSDTEILNKTPRGSESSVKNHMEDRNESTAYFSGG